MMSREAARMAIVLTITSPAPDPETHADRILDFLWGSVEPATPKEDDDDEKQRKQLERDADVLVWFAMKGASAPGQDKRPAEVQTTLNLIANRIRGFIKRPARGYIPDAAMGTPESSPATQEER